MMGGGNLRRQQRINPKTHINSIISVRRLKYSIHMVRRSDAPVNVAMNEGDTNAEKERTGRKFILLHPMHRMVKIFGFKWFNGKPTYDGV